MTRYTRKFAVGQIYDGIELLEQVTGQRWRLRCHCGNIFEYRAAWLGKGKKRCCGCTTKERIRQGQLKHGHFTGDKASAEARIYSGMRSRCYNPRVKEYRLYGARGVTVCDRWLDDFRNFLADMGPRPPKHSLDRIDPNGPYSPENCRWATMKEQERNRRNNCIVPDGRVLAQVAEDEGIRYSRLKHFYRAARLPLEEAIARCRQPARQGHHKGQIPTV